MTARWLGTTEAAEWIELDPDRWTELRVRCLVPRTFERFARVFHPLHLQGHGRELRWSDVAVINGRSMHPHVRLIDVLVREDEIVENAGQLLSGQSGVGVLLERQWRELFRVLRPYTSSTSLILGFWEGFDVERVSGPRPKVKLADRNYVLAELPPDESHQSHQLNPRYSPNVVWPTDRAWFWHTEIDELSTYVGASADAIGAVLASDALEAVAVDVDDLL